MGTIVERLRPVGTRHGIAWRAVAYSLGLSAVLGAVVVVSAAIGPVAIPPASVAKALLNAVAVPVGAELTAGRLPVGPVTLPVPAVSVSYASPFEFPVEDTHRTIVVAVRMPRIALGAIVGLSLAAAGTVMQGFFRNPMADPSIVGVSSGAAAGAVAAIALPGLVPVGLRPAAAVGGLVAAFGVYATATEGGRTPVATLLLVGIAVQTFLGAVVSFLLLHTGDSLERAVYWLMGHLSGTTWDEVTATALVVPPLLAVLLAYAREMNVLLMGEAEAHTMGVDVERTKRILLAAATVLTAASVALTGVIGFVGLVVPHAMRLLVGPDHRVLLPTSAVAGGAFLVAADTAARTAMSGAELPVGIVTAALGAPFFLYLLCDREVHEL